MELGLSTKILGVGARGCALLWMRAAFAAVPGKRNRRSLRCAPVGMTILRAALSSGICSAGAEGNRRSLHYAALRSG
jgi:hypothetical protein